MTKCFRNCSKPADPSFGISAYCNTSGRRGIQSVFIERVLQIGPGRQATVNECGEVKQFFSTPAGVAVLRNAIYMSQRLPYTRLLCDRHLHSSARAVEKFVSLSLIPFRWTSLETSVSPPFAAKNSAYLRLTSSSLSFASATLSLLAAKIPMQERPSKIASLVSVCCLPRALDWVFAACKAAIMLALLILAISLRRSAVSDFYSRSERSMPIGPRNPSQMHDFFQFLHFELPGE